MTDETQIRINELARELEVKAKAVIDYLPEAGVTEKKTHSSSIDLSAAERVRKHFRDLAAAEEAAAAQAEKDKAAKEAAAKAARLRPARSASSRRCSARTTQQLRRLRPHPRRPLLLQPCANGSGVSGSRQPLPCAPLRQQSNCAGLPATAPTAPAKDSCAATAAPRQAHQFDQPYRLQLVRRRQTGSTGPRAPRPPMRPGAPPPPGARPAAAPGAGVRPGVPIGQRPPMRPASGAMRPSARPAHAPGRSAAAGKLPATRHAETYAPRRVGYVAQSRPSPKGRARQAHLRAQAGSGARAAHSGEEIRGR